MENSEFGKKSGITRRKLLHSLNLAWTENFGEKDQKFGKSGIGSFKYSIEKEIGISMVWGIYYGGSFIEDDYFQRYGMSVKYNR